MGRHLNRAPLNSTELCNTGAMDDWQDWGKAHAREVALRGMLGMDWSEFTIDRIQIE
jgi:hypothetical protein